jgi:hypothetical protein
MNELDPDLYREKLARVGRRYDSLTAWMALGVAAFLFAGYALMSEGSSTAEACPTRLQDPAQQAAHPPAVTQLRDGAWTQRADRQDLDSIGTEREPRPQTEPAISLCR